MACKRSWVRIPLAPFFQHLLIQRFVENHFFTIHPGKRWNGSYTENRIRRIFQHYVSKAGLQQVYGNDYKGRNLKMFTVHSLRHTHVTRYVIDRELSLPIVQKRVGHRSLKTMSIFLSPSTEKMAQAYKQTHLT
jgi:integrase